VEKSILIVGGGIAGLAAGCYGQMNGYKTQIFELHSVPGGLCTGWKRNGYVFDGCVHWLVGSNPDSSFNQIWRELGVAQGRTMVNHDYYMRYEGREGKVLFLYTNIDRLEAHMKELAPVDSHWISELTGAIRQMTQMEMPVDGPEGILDSVGMGLKMLTLLPALNKWSKLTMEDVTARFQDPFMKEAFSSVYSDMDDFSAIGFVMMMAWMHRQDAGYPVGGSLEFARAMERRYLSLGGEIHYKARVSKILVEDGQAVGLQLTDGTTYRGDRIVSAADGHSTIFNLLEGKYINETIRGYYEQLPMFAPTVQVSLGINRDLSLEPHMVVARIDPAIKIDGQERETISLRHFCCDPTMAPAGKSVVTTIFMANYEYWKALGGDPAAYAAEKQRVADLVIEQLERRLPGIKAQIEVVDVATPLTTERYTANWKGSMEGWMVTPETVKFMFGKGMEKTLPGLENFYMIGQWVEPGGGLPTAALSARKLFQQLCKADGRHFQAPILE